MTKQTELSNLYINDSFFSAEDKFVEINFILNGSNKTAFVKPHWTLLQVLRDQLGFTGTKEACGEGACGSCTVIIDGVSVLACMMLAIEHDGKEITSIEGLAKDEKLHPLQESWLEEYGAQCGFCSPGMIMSSKGFLDKHPEATKEEIAEAMGGNICICGNYEHILNSVLKGQEKLLNIGEYNDKA